MALNPEPSTGRLGPAAIASSDMSNMVRFQFESEEEFVVATRVQEITDVVLENLGNRRLIEALLDHRHLSAGYQGAPWSSS
jgi:hypothetical protein